MRILIAGAGIAGLTLAALLKQRGMRCTVVERSRDFHHLGYMLSLYPLGNRVLHGLGLHDGLLAAGEPANHYRMCNGHGELVQEFDFEEIARRFGPIVSIGRPELIDLLLTRFDRASLRFGTTITRIDERGPEVEVVFSDGGTETFDLVIGADGLHSAVRRHLLGDTPLKRTGWGGWVWWTDEADTPNDTITEFWGMGRFLGIYPVKGRYGVFAGGPVETLHPDQAEGRTARLKALLAPFQGKARAVLDSLPDDHSDVFFWDLADSESVEWARGRVALCGDAAAGFLPTAGIGASMAMESAAALADELSRADAGHVENALHLYVTRRRKRVEGMQADSRHLAKMMLVESQPVAWTRDQLMRFYSIDMLIKNIAKSFSSPI